MREHHEGARESRTESEAGRATPEAIAQVARILRRRWSTRRESERAELAARPIPRVSRPPR